MIISSEVAQSAWLNWSGSELTFACGFQALDVAHVFGSFRDSSTHVVSPLTQGTDFTVTLDVNNVVTAAPLAGMPSAAGQVQFYRETPALKGVEFIDLGSYSAETHDEYYAADALRAAELRRDIAASVTIAAGDVAADDVSYPGGGVGLAATTVRMGLDELAQRKLIGLPDVNITPGPPVDQYRVTWDNATQRFVLAQQAALSGPAIVSAINTELGGTTWQGGGGAGGEVNVGSNIGTGGALGVYFAKSGLQLQFRGFRPGVGLAAVINATTNSIDYSLDLSYADARYVLAGTLAAVAFSGAYSALTGKPVLGLLADNDVIGFADIVATAIASLADAQAGVAADKLMTPQRVKDAIAALSIASSRQIIAGSGLSGGGDLSANRTIDLRTPHTVSGSSTNDPGGSVGHTHALSLDALDVVPVGYGAGGAYGFMQYIGSGTINPGVTTAGTNVRFSGINSSGGIIAGGVPAGSTIWRNMGAALPNGAVGLFVRTS